MEYSSLAEFSKPLQWLWYCVFLSSILRRVQLFSMSSHPSSVRTPPPTQGYANLRPYARTQPYSWINTRSVGPQFIRTRSVWCGYSWLDEYTDLKWRWSFHFVDPLSTFGYSTSLPSHGWFDLCVTWRSAFSVADLTNIDLLFLRCFDVLQKNGD